jgi:hypothetical protein
MNISKKHPSMVFDDLKTVYNDQSSSLGKDARRIALNKKSKKLIEDKPL